MPTTVPFALLTPTQFMPRRFPELTSDESGVLARARTAGVGGMLTIGTRLDQFERVIGRRTGTGGSAGVDYLDQTALKYRVFGDVWAIRTLLVQKSAVPRSVANSVAKYVLSVPAKPTR